MAWTPWRWRPNSVDPALGLSDAEMRRLRLRVRNQQPSESERRALQRASIMMRPIPLTRGRMAWGELMLAMTPPAVYMAVIAAMFIISGFHILFLIIALPVQVVLTWLVMAQLSQRVASPRWRLALREAGYAACLRCGYIMEGLDPEGACPECGMDHAGVPVAERRPATLEARLQQVLEEHGAKRNEPDSAGEGVSP